jgi:hypothetical protein
MEIAKLAVIYGISTESSIYNLGLWILRPSNSSKNNQPEPIETAQFEISPPNLSDALKSNFEAVS